MTLSPLGKQYICKNFGDVSLCCVKTGLSWYYTAGGTDYHEIGGTAQIVFRLASGWIDSLTMTSPSRGAFTKAEMDAANESVVDPRTDPLEITEHDEPTEVQWCFIPCEDHTDKTTCVNVYKCFWYDDGTGIFCHPTVVCSSINNPTDCEDPDNGCYWWNNSCHPNPPTCEELDNPADCQRYFPGYYWYDNGTGVFCHPTLVCESIVDPNHCLANGCFYYRGTCHAVDQPELCYWIDDHGGPNALTIVDVFTIADAWLLNTPPAGYTFIPTIQNVFGVADYWMGFIDSGNNNTGCSYVG